MAFKFRHIICFATLLLGAVTAVAQTAHRRLTGLIEADAKHSRTISFDLDCRVVDQEGNNIGLSVMPAKMHTEPVLYDKFKGACTSSYPLTEGNKGVSFPIADGYNTATSMSIVIGPVKTRAENRFGQQVHIMTDGMSIDLKSSYQRPDETIWVGTYHKYARDNEVANGKIVLHERKNVPAKPAPATAKPKALPAAMVTTPPAPKPTLIQAAHALVTVSAPDTLYKYPHLYRFASSGLKVSAWDNYHVDGEIVRFSYGTHSEDIKLTADKQGFTYYLPSQKVTVFTLTMINEGTDPGNTVSVTFSDGAKDYSFEVNGHVGQSFIYYFWHE